MNRFTLTIWLFSSLPLLLLPIGCATDTQVHNLEQKVDTLIRLNEIRSTGSDPVATKPFFTNKLMIEESRRPFTVGYKLRVFVGSSSFPEEFVIDDIGENKDGYIRFKELTTQKWIRTNAPFIVTEIDVGESKSGEIEISQTP